MTMCSFPLLPWQLSPQAPSTLPLTHQNLSLIWKSPWSRLPSPLRRPMAEVSKLDSQRIRQIPKEPHTYYYFIRRIKDSFISIFMFYYYADWNGSRRILQFAMSAAGKRCFSIISWANSQGSYTFPILGWARSIINANIFRIELEGIKCWLRDLLFNILLCKSEQE
jgi:hypothetical protein